MVRTTQGLWYLALTLAGLELISVAAHAGQQDSSGLRISVFSPARVEEGERARARLVATRLLDSAAVRATWHDCASSVCEPRQDEALSVTVLIVNDQPGSDRDACGRAARAPGAAGTVFVDLTCIRDVVQYAKGALADRAHPAAAGLTIGDLLGVVIAHEVGHLLGLAHTRTGVMRARLRLEEIVALHTGRLAFSSVDAATMRASLPRAPDTHTAQRRSP